MSDNTLGVVIKPADIAAMAAFLASEAGRCITGQEYQHLRRLEPGTLRGLIFLFRYCSGAWPGNAGNKTGRLP